MKCKKFQKEIERYLEGEMGSADKALLEKHLSQCASCTGILREAREEVYLYREALSRFRLGDSLRESVLPRLRVIPAPRIERAVAAEVKRWHIFSLSAAAVALFIFTFWASGFWLPAPAQPPAQEPVQAKKEEPSSGAVFETSLVRVYWKVPFAPYHYYRGGESAG
jgi:predicted anti-sigma-YlaC factor YlaD